MSKVRICGGDPGFANVGFSILDLTSTGVSDLLATKLIVTKKGKIKGREIKDEIRRIREIEDVFISFIDEWQPDVLAFEEPGKGLMPNTRGGKGRFSVNPKTLRTTCLMWGAIEGICRARGIYVVEYTSQAIKKAVCNSNKASKADMEAEIKSRYGGYDAWAATKKVEHEIDSVGAAITAFKEPFVMTLLRTLETRK